MKIICGMSVNRALLVSAFATLLVMPWLTQVQAAETQQKTTITSHDNETTQAAIIRTRIAQGYSVIGPLELKGASRTELVIATPDQKDPVTVSLKNKTVTVSDESGNSLTISSVKKGSNVIICQKSDKVVIYVLASATKETGNENNR